MKAAVVSFARGAAWVGEGWRLYRVAPLTWLMMVFLYWVTMMFVSRLPAVGVALAVALIPPFSVGFMAASRSCAAGRAAGIADLFAAFRDGLRAQLVLGALYFALLSAAIWLTELADGGALMRLLGGQERVVTDEALTGAIVFALAYTPLMMMYWFGPVLVAWHGIGVAKALFFSAAACVMNWRALTGYGVALALVTIVVPILVMSAVLIAVGGRKQAEVMGMTLVMLLLLMPMLFASFYASYRDVFGAGDSPAPAPEAAPPPQ